MMIMDTNSAMDLVKEHLKQPEYLHTLLRVFPAEGLSLATLGLIISLILKSRPAQITALVLVFICTASIWPVVYFGEQGYDHVESISSDAGNQWLDAHAQRGVKGQYAFYVIAAVSLAALVVSIISHRKPEKLKRTATTLNCVTLLLCFMGLWVGAWISYAGGQIRHSEFRYGTPPEKPGVYENSH